MKCILICLLIFSCGFASEILALRCASPDGLSVEDVRKVVKKCMKKVTQSDSDTKNYDEFENFDNDYEMPSNHRDADKAGNSRRNNNERPSNTYGNNFNPRINQHYDAQTGGNYNDPRTNDRRDANPYQLTYNDNNNVNNRNNFYGSQNHNDGRRNDSTDLKHDRACVLQCFFQELKMTNNEGFPDKHKALHVLTKELRDRELKDFYTDSIQECFRMTDNDPQLHRDKCLYSKAVIACLADRASMNCSDWNGETVIF